jgi:hypothetical protein
LLGSHVFQTVNAIGGVVSVMELLGGTLIALVFVVVYVVGMRLPKRQSLLRVKAPAPPPPPENLEHIVRTIAERDEERRRWLWPIGVFGRLVTYAALFLILYVNWPEDVWQKPLAILTLSDIFGTVFAFALVLLLGRALFEPSNDEEIKDLWGGVGVLILGGVVVGAILLKRG